jgi:hypothetical protein
MEFCPKCQKTVAIRKDLTGCLIDPLTDEEEVRFSYYCSECHTFIRSFIEKSVNKDARVTKNGKSL